MRFFLVITLALAFVHRLSADDTNTVATNSAPPVAETNSPAVEKEYKQILDADDAAQAEVDKWITENNEFRSKGAGLPDADMNRRIRERFDPVRAAYEDFIRRHPNYARARIAYGSFLGDLQDEAGARKQWEKALELDPKNPAVYNNLAGVYSETGPADKVFEFFSKAIELNSSEALYYHNFGNSIYVLRSNAMAYYHINEQQVFSKALMLYSNAVRLDPGNFPFASDLAQTYYALKPFQAEMALKCWTNVLKLAHDDLERQGVLVHLARVKMVAGHLAEARAQLKEVTNENYNVLKGNLLRSIEQRESEGTNAPVVTGAVTNKAAWP